MSTVVGTYVVTYTVTDSSGNSTSISRTVNVVDVNNPVISFSPNGNNTYAQSYSTIINVTDNAALNPNSFKYLWKTNAINPLESDFVNPFTNNETINTPSNVSGSYYLWIIAKD